MRSSEEIEREVEATRGELDRTVEALKERMSAGQIIDELMGSMKGTGASEMVGNLGRQAKDNPIPLALIGAGIAWLMFGRPPSKAHYEPRSFVVDPYTGDATIEDEAGYQAAYDPDAARYHEDYDPLTGADLGAQSAKPRLKDKAGQAAQKVKDAASGVAHKASGVASKVGQAAHSGKERVTHGVSGARQGMDQARGRAGERVQAGRQRLSSAAGSVRGQAAQYGRRAQRTYYETLESEPLILAAVGVAVGAAIGAALPASRFENRTVGRFRDRALDQGKQMAQQRVQEAKEIAESALGAAKEEADRQGMPTGVDTLADKVGQAARAGLDTAKREMDERRTH